MPPVLYKRQRQILDFIKQFIEANGHAPTLRAIADAIGVSSLATVHEHLETLEKKKLIKRSHGKTRSIELLESDVNLDKPHAVSAPILGFIAAGAPLEPFTDPNATLPISPTFASGKKRIYVLQVKGNSMIEEGIFNNDHVVIEHTETAKDGDIVVALLDNGMATLKRFFRESTRVRLEPANSAMQPIFVKNVQVQGKVVGLIRRYIRN